MTGLPQKHGAKEAARKFEDIISAFVGPDLK